MTLVAIPCTSPSPGAHRKREISQATKSGTQHTNAKGQRPKVGTATAYKIPDNPASVAPHHVPPLANGERRALQRCAALRSNDDSFTSRDSSEHGRRAHLGGHSWPAPMPALTVPKVSLPSAPFEPDSDQTEAAIRIFVAEAGTAASEPDWLIAPYWHGNMLFAVKTPFTQILPIEVHVPPENA